MGLQGKLVRDGIPRLIAENGAKPLTRSVGVEDLHDYLRAKLVEETREYLDSGDPVELADILEVLYELAAQDQISRERLQAQWAATPATRPGDPAEHLREALVAQVKAYLHTGGVAGLAEVFAVVQTLAAAQHRLNPERLEALRAAKAQVLGGFSGRIVWLGNAPVAA